jgi:transposase-like protein
MKTEVAEDIRTICNALDAEEASRQLRLKITEYEEKAPRLSKWMEEAIP